MDPKMDSPAIYYVHYKTFGKMYVKITYNKNANEVNIGFKIAIHLTS